MKGFGKWLVEPLPPCLYYGLDENNEPVELRTGQELIDWVDSGRKWHLTDIIGEIYVSTLFLGINTHLGCSPVLWETMIFYAESMESLDQRRYSSREAAKQGHKEEVAKARSKLHDS